MKAIEKINIAKEDADVFLSHEKTQDEVGETGAKLSVSLYGGKVCDDLTDLRYSKYMNIDAKPIKIKPRALSPTKRPAHFQSLHAYHQLHEWNNLNSEVPTPEDWGWKLKTIGTSQL